MKTAGAKKPRWQQGELGNLIHGRAPHSFIVLVVIVMFGLTLSRVKHDSPTEDEWAHLVRGISYFETRDMRVHVQHPPLANALDALPSAFDKNPDVTQMKTWKEGYSPGLEYIKLDYARARAQLNKGRYVAALFLVGLAVYLFYFCLSVFGWPTAAAVTCLVAFNPTLMGQARYVATDMPVAALAAVATGELVRYLSNSKRIVSLGFALAGLVLSKHSGVVILIFVVLVALLAAWLGRGIFQAEASRPRRLLRWLGHLSIAGLIVLFSINAVYKFDHTGMTVREILDAPEPQHWVTKSYRGQMLEQRSPLPQLPEKLRIPLPYSYLFGLFAVQEQNRGGYPTYFLGKQSHDGHWAYFPVLLLTKSPPALLVLLGLGAVIFWKSRRGAAKPERDRSPPGDEASPARSATLAAEASARPGTFFWGLSLGSACFLCVAALFFVFIVRSNLNMGIRHALPVIPLLSVLAGRAFARAGELASGRHLLALRAVGLSAVLSALLTVPAYLNYYNLLALGQGSKINVVGDDWGQDREAFVRFAKQRDLQPLYYHTQTPTRKLEVDYLGLKYRELNCRTRPAPGSWVAIHAQYVHRFEATKKCATWMRGLEPTDKINENVWIYRIPAEAGRS